jgi:hypothetical protein
MTSTTIKTSTVLGFAALAIAWLIYVAVIPYQRRSVLVALDNLTLYDGTDRTRVISQLSKGASAEVVACRDIEPAIRLSDGRLAYPTRWPFQDRYQIYRIAEPPSLYRVSVLMT